MRGNGQDPLLSALRSWGRAPISPLDPAASQERERRGTVTLAASIRSAEQERRRGRQRWFVGLAAAAVALGALGWQGPKFREGLDLPGQTGSAAPVLAPSEPGEPGAVLRRDAEIRVLTGEVSLDRQAQRRWLQAGRAPSQLLALRGDLLRAESHEARISLGAITRVQLHEGAELRLQALDEEQQHVRLAEGEVHFQVDPERKARVTIDAGDARVIVTGTEFTVRTGKLAASAGEPARPLTEVLVTRGHVRVEHESGAVSLSAGESWSSQGENSARESAWDAQAGREATAGDLASTGHPAGTGRLGRTQGSSASQGSSADRAVLARAQGGRSRAPDGRSGDGSKSAPATPATTLAEENALFRSAVTARNQGSPARCVSLLNRLLTQHPATPLRQEALVARFRCQAAAGGGAVASQSAARYLAEYPAGFAREEARSLVLNKP